MKNLFLLILLSTIISGCVPPNTMDRGFTYYRTPTSYYSQYHRITPDNLGYRRYNSSRYYGDNDSEYLSYPTSR